MYNEITRKLTSLTLMTVMLAGGMTIAFPGMEPAFAAGELSVSAEAIGNFAGLQVIEIVVDDPDRSETDSAQGVPNVEINGKDITMIQGNDGSWYAYVANNLAVNAYEGGQADVVSTFYGGVYDATPVAALGTDAIAVFNATTAFLDGSKALSPEASNTPGVTTAEWPIIQTYDMSDNTDQTFTYGTGSTAETVVLRYDYDDNKDVSLDRIRYPASSGVMITLDDTLLNLSPTAEDYWGFNSTQTHYFLEGTTALTAATTVTWTDVGFEEGPIVRTTPTTVFDVRNSAIHDNIQELDGSGEPLIIIRESNTDDNVFVNYDNTDFANIVMDDDVKTSGSASVTYNSAHSIILDSFDGLLAFTGLAIEEWLSGVALDVELTDEDRNLNTRTDETITILDGEVPFIKIGSPVHIDTLSTNGTLASTGTLSKVYNMTIPALTDTVFVNATWPYATATDAGYVQTYLNVDFSNLGGAVSQQTFNIGNPSDTIPLNVNNYIIHYTNATWFAVEIPTGAAAVELPVYLDILSFGQLDDVADAVTGDIKDNVVRVNDAFYRFELEETDDNTAKFTGTVEYIMINQINVFDSDTYDNIETADVDNVIIVNDDFDGVDAVRISYNDVDSTTNNETISAQEDANTHSGSISVDSTGYSSGNTITVILEDVDLNTDSDTQEIYDVDAGENWVGLSNVWLSQLTINDLLYAGCAADKTLALNATGLSFIETGKATGIFEGTLKLPTDHCNASGAVTATNGLDIEFEYQDYSDSSGNPNETSTSASIQSNTGAIILDKTVYGVPFLTYDTHLVGDSLPATPVTFVIQVDDPDYNQSANGEDQIANSKIKLFIKRGSDSTVDLINQTSATVGLGPLIETDPQSGIFELEVSISQTTGTASQSLLNGGLIKQGDIISVEYTDDNDASGSSNTVTDSATFDLRNAVLQADKLEYIIGTEAIITLIEPDLNMDSDTEETLSLELIEWDSDAGTKNLSYDDFNAQPAGLRETGPDTGIFQVIIEIPQDIDGDKLERGEQITFEYVDQGPAGADFVGDDDEDITMDIYTSDFGASVTLDQKVYTWTDKVYITVVSPDHNFDSNSIDEIGGADKIVQVYTRGEKIKDYKFVESGPDTGIFTGEIILTGFAHDADGDGFDDNPNNPTGGSGPTDGYLGTDSDDGLTVSFEASDNEVFTGGALIRWNIGEVQFLEASYPASGTAVVRVIDPDMNWNPEAVDSFDVNVWSDSSAGGISLSVTETNEATGIFEGTVTLTVTDSSSGSRLRVAEGDTIIAEYEDNTLPDPYSKADELGITATTLVGTIVPPLDRAPASNLKAVDAFGNSLSTLSVDQQVQVTANLVNGQDRDQEFAYLLQVQDGDGVTVSLSWITGTLTPEQSLSPAVSWIPQNMGDYTATAFVWQSVDNPTALSPPVTTTLKVN